ncbi:MAG: phospho-N-acetylmuramoyl-pentapeptide-transferase [Deltaproteobacteria bacterium]|nr:phospho-N-acetylmuramoyl-pentapeptide-transferase [Deltaproteobacteria bacterium]
MIYNLLYPYVDAWPLLNVLRYPSFRITMAGLTALMVSLFLGPWFIRQLRVAQHGKDTVREDTPESHQEKQGTPSMGGVLILISLLLGTLLWADLRSRLVWTVVMVTFSFGVIGFLDDWTKFRNKSKGLSGKMRLALEFGLAGLFLLIFNTDLDLTVVSEFPWVLVGYGIDTHVALPFVGTHLFNPDLGWLYPFLALGVIVGTANGTNLTDGLDGLAIGPSIVAAMTWLVLAYVAGTVLSGFNLAEYLYIPHIDGASELSVYCAALAGAGIGFLWYNTYPASVFMGDVGSLALGGGLGTLAILTKNELVSAIVHGLFLLEALSVIVQVGSFKLTGKRVFRMAPIHHHFELKGWQEPKIIVRAWVISIMFALIALAGLKLR